MPTAVFVTAAAPPMLVNAAWRASVRHGVRRVDATTIVDDARSRTGVTPTSPSSRRARQRPALLRGDAAADRAVSRTASSSCAPISPTRWSRARSRSTADALVWSGPIDGRGRLLQRRVVRVRARRRLAAGNGSRRFARSSPRWSRHAGDATFRSAAPTASHRWHRVQLTTAAPVRAGSGPRSTSTRRIRSRAARSESRRPRARAARRRRAARISSRISSSPRCRTSSGRR